LLLPNLKTRGKAVQAATALLKTFHPKWKYISIPVMEPTNVCNLITLLFAQSGCKPCKLYPPGSFLLLARELTTHVKPVTWFSLGSAFRISNLGYTAFQPGTRPSRVLVNNSAYLWESPAGQKVKQGN
jgi:hypothetical protein